MPVADSLPRSRLDVYKRQPPYGVTDQADFLNGGMEIQTLLTPEELLDALHAVSYTHLVSA